jgi:Sec-independent protein secretion pathway component TatC
MSGKIVGFIREYIFALSIICLIVGIIVMIFPIIHYAFTDIQPELIESLEEWNFYLIIIGFVLIITGIWYLYVYLKNRKFIFEEVDTNKRSEFMKRHGELTNVVRKMPTKFQEMVEEKERELNIR